MLRSVTLGLALSVLAAACALIEPPQPEPSRALQLTLAEWGLQFTPAPVPESGVVSADDVLRFLHRVGAPPDAADRTADPPVFGTMRCVIREECLDGPLADPQREPIPVWVVEFPRAPRPDGGHAWVVAEAATGDLMWDDRSRLQGVYP